MEYALTADHHRVHAFDAEKGQEYYCPVCGNQVIPRQGEVNSWHFAHVTSCMDDWKYDMSEWHRGWQSRFPENVREIVVEHRGECHRADILMGGLHRRRITVKLNCANSFPVRRETHCILYSCDIDCSQSLIQYI